MKAADRLLPLLVEGARQLRIGSGEDPANGLTPVITVEFYTDTKVITGRWERRAS